MALGIGQTASSGIHAGTRTTETVTLASPASVGHTLISVLFHRGGVGFNHNPPAGWTKVTQFNGDYGTIDLAYKDVETGDDDCVWTFSSTSHEMCAYLIETDAPAVFDVSAARTDLALPLTIPTITPADDQDVLLLLALMHQPSQNTAISGWTKDLVEFNSGGNRSRYEVYSQAIDPTSGGYGGDAVTGPTDATTDGDYYLFSFINGFVAPPIPGPGKGIHFTVDGVEFTGLKRKEIRVELNRPGNGVFVINRYDPQATEANLARGTIVSVTIGDIHPTPIFDFIIEEGDFALISSDEHGGEDLTFGGRGTLSMLSRAILKDAQELVGDDTACFPDEGVWRWTGQTPGFILKKMIEEAQVRSPDPLPGFTCSFFGDTDSDGEDWDPIGGTWEAAIGSSVLEEALKLIDYGQMRVRMKTGLQFDAFKDLGSNLTGDFGPATVRFEKGINIESELTRQMSGREWASHVKAKIKDGYTDWITLPGAPYRQEAFLDLSGVTDDEAVAETAAEQQLAYRDDAQNGMVLVVPYEGRDHVPNDPSNGWYYPGPPASDHGKYWIGDLVTLHTGTGELDFDEQAVRVYAITFSEDPTGALAPPIVELNAPYIDPVAKQSITGSTGRRVLPHGGSDGSTGGAGGTGSSGGSGSTSGTKDHGALYGKADDDHPQYQLRDERGQPSGYAGLDPDGINPTYRLGFFAGGAGADTDPPTDGYILTSDGTDQAVWEAAPGASGTTAAIGLIIPGGGAVITTGSKGFLEVPFDCIIESSRLFADQSGSITISIKKATYSGFPTTSSIVASAKPTLSSAQKSQDTTLTGWTTTLTKGDVLEWVVDTVTTVTQVTSSLVVQKT